MDSASPPRSSAHAYGGSSTLDTVDWGLPGVIVGAAGAVAQAVSLHRQARAEEVSEKLAVALASFDEAEILRRLTEDPRLADIVDTAVREALASVSDERVDLLMFAVRRGLETETDTEVDEAHFHTRTLASLEVAHLSVFRAVVRPRHGSGQMRDKLLVGHVSLLELASLVPGTTVVGDQILARLVAEGLVYRHETELLSIKITGGPHVSATPAGDRFATWLGVS